MFEVFESHVWILVGMSVCVCVCVSLRVVVYPESEWRWLQDVTRKQDRGFALRHYSFCLFTPSIPLPRPLFTYTVEYSPSLRICSCSRELPPPAPSRHHAAASIPGDRFPKWRSSEVFLRLARAQSHLKKVKQTSNHPVLSETWQTWIQSGQSFCHFIHVRVKALLRLQDIQYWCVQQQKQAD